MIHTCSILDQPAPGLSFEDRWEGPDRGFRTSWLRGIEKAASEPDLRDAALRGELPVLAWKGGGKSIKAGKRLGSLHYLAMWQGLRGEDLCIEDVGGIMLKRTGVTDISIDRHHRRSYACESSTFSHPHTA